MTILGPSSDYTGSTRTQGDKKTFIAGMRTFLADLFGTDSSDKAVVRAQLGAATLGTSTCANALLNSSFQVNNDVTPGTTDNSYVIDGWRMLLETATAATAARDTTLVRTGGSGYSLKLTVGAANNNKFGVWAVVEGKEVAPFRGGVASVRFPLAATAGLTNGTGKIRAALLLWTGTLDSLSADPISAWGAEGRIQRSRPAGLTRRRRWHCRWEPRSPTSCWRIRRSVLARTISP